MTNALRNAESPVTTVGEASPAVTVVVPTCSRPKLLRIALKSLARQMFRNFEVVVVNDGEDPVLPVIQEFSDALDIHLVEHEHKRSGISAARNSGIARASGRYITYLDDDDIYYDNALKELVEACQAGYQVVYADAALAVQRLFDGEYETVRRSVPLSRDFDRNFLAARNITPVNCVIHERACLRRSGFFAPYLFGHEDWDLWQRLARHYTFGHLPVLTGEYTTREGQGSLSTQKQTMRESWIFLSHQGLLHSALPPVPHMQAVAAGAVLLGAPSARPARLSVVLGFSRLDAEAQERLRALSLVLGDAELVLAAPGAPEELMGFSLPLKKLLRRPPRLVCMPGDAGRVMAANAGAQAAGGEWLLFLEEDVRPLPGSLEALLAAAESPEARGAGALSGVIETPSRSGIYGGAFTARGELIFAAEPGAAHGELRRVRCVPSLCFMVRRTLFLEQDGFDLAFAPGHYADAAFCHKLAASGHGSFIVPGARFAWNEGGAALTQSPAGLVSRRTFWDRHATAPFALDRFLGGADWSMRARLWASDGIMPGNFDVSVPKKLL